MACPLTGKLPVELLDMIARGLLPSSAAGDESASTGRLHVLNLSSTCRALREKLTPVAFERLHIANVSDRKLTSAVLAAKVYGQHIKVLHFIGGAHDVPSNTLSPGFRLSRDAVPLLLGTYTPNLYRLIVSWDFNFQGLPENIPLQSLFALDRPESLAQVERGAPWRALMKEVWQHIARNPYVYELILSPVIPKLSCIWVNDPAWKDFLGRLRLLKIEFPQTIDPQNPAFRWRGYRQFVFALTESFLQNAGNLRSLAISGAEDAFMGLWTFPYFEAVRLHHLTSLSLSCIWLRKDLVPFLSKHCSTLTCVVFINCWAASKDDHENALSWAEVFEALQESRSSLKHFSCLPDGEDCYTWHSQIFDDDLESDYNDQWGDCAAAFKAAGKRAFGYATSVGAYSKIGPVPLLVQQSLERGDDHRAYESLMSKVKANSNAGVHS